MVGACVRPQAAPQGNPSAAVTARDTAFWQAYNACDTAAMRTFFSEDVEGKVYGAVMTGEHLFYLREPGKAEFPDGRARFAHLWLLKDGAWRMARVLSYDHGPATR
jgi:hypothetical protein